MFINSAHANSPHGITRAVTDVRRWTCAELLLWQGEKAAQPQWITSYLWHLCVLHTFDANLWSVRNCTVTVCKWVLISDSAENQLFEVVLFYHFWVFFLEKYKGIIIFSTVVIVQLYAVQLNPIYKYCVCTLYITLYTLKNETLMPFCALSLDQKDILLECHFEGLKRWFFANVAEVFTVFMWKMFVWTEWKKHSSGPYGRNWTQSAVDLTATWASFGWAPTL